MKKFKSNSKIVYLCFISICLLFLGFIFPALSSGANHTTNPTMIEHESRLKNLTDTPPTDPQITPINSISSSQFGWSGPFTFAISRDGLNGYFADARYTQKINENFAVSGIGDYGRKMYRFGGTLGFKFLNSNLLKISAERLSQVLPFIFDSGNINERMGQNAYGARYQHIFENNNFWQTLSFGGYYSNVSSKWLAPVYFSLNGENAINYRRIAGGIAKGVDLGADLKLTNTTTLTGKVYYDAVNYDTVLNNPQTPNYDSRGVGGGVSLNQLIGDYLNLSLEGDSRKIYDTYKARLSWLPPFLSNIGLELSFSAERIVSHNDTPSANGVALSFSFNPELIGKSKVKYQSPSARTFSDIANWTSIPAVRMERVLAQAEQLTQILPKPAGAIAQLIVTAITPTIGDLAGGDEVTIKGQNFKPTTAVKFAETIAKIKSFKNNEIVVITPKANTATAVESSTVEVKIDDDHGAEKIIGGFTYVASGLPIVTELTPNSSLLLGNTAVTIKGKNFTNAKEIKFGEQKAISYKVESDTKITALSPAAKEGTVHVTVATPKGTSVTSNSDNFAYTNSATRAVPIISSLSPNTSRKGGGTEITITGTNLTGATGVEFFFIGHSGAVNALSYQVVNDSTIKMVTPPLPSDSTPVDHSVVVITPQGTSNQLAITYGNINSPADIFNISK